MKQFKKEKKDSCNKRSKNFISLQNINNLKLLKQKFENLPTNQNYLSSQEASYLRIVTQIIDIIPKIRLEQIQYIISQENFRKLFVQLNCQSEHKEIILSLLKCILKGIEIYRSLIAVELYQILDFLIQIEGLQIQKSNLIVVQSNNSNMRKYVMSLSLFTLIQSIIKWYCTGIQPCKIKDKYTKLKNKMQKQNK